MLSSVRHIRKSAPVLLGAQALFLLGSSAHAASDSRFVLTAYTDAAGGERLLHGDYPGAMREIDRRAHLGGPEALAVNANRCVALIMMQQWEAAHASCDKAVRDAQEDNAGQPLLPRRPESDELALAYSNRAVLKWLSETSAAAAQDLARAQALSPRADYVARNVTALGSHSTVASRPGAPRR
jgi:hypothetical protein